MMTRILYIGLAALLLFLVGCSGSTTPGTTPSPSPSATSVARPTSPVESTSTPPAPITLLIWLPPQFDPESGTQAGELLKARLAEFSARRPGTRVEVRLKSQEGLGGLLDALTTTNAAAPLNLPDLIALPRQILELAALKGLLHPYDGLQTLSENSEWYDYARQLSRLQNSTFGIPFAGDALLLLYRPSVVVEPPSEWQSALGTAGPLAFSAADAQSLFTLTLYQTAGGQIQDEQGRPSLQVEALTQVLTFYQEAERVEWIPFWTTQLQTDEQVWEAFLDQRANLAVTWASRYLSELPADSDAAPIPTSDGTPYTLATGWVWALASPQPERQERSAELAEFLTQSEFLAQWTEAAGFLPTSPAALSAWTSSSLRSIASQVSISAQLVPSEDILYGLALPLQEASLLVLKEQADPLEAAQAAIERLGVP